MWAYHFSTCSGFNGQAASDRRMASMFISRMPEMCKQWHALPNWPQLWHHRQNVLKGVNQYEIKAAVVWLYEKDP